MFEKELLVLRSFTLRIIFSNDENYYVLFWGELSEGGPTPGRYFFDEGDILFVHDDIRHRRLNGITNLICGPRPDILNEYKARGLLRE